MDREAQQKISHAASLYELQFMDGHPVHIDVYSNLMQECALMGGKDETLDNIYTSVLYSDAMGMFLAARHVSTPLLLPTPLHPPGVCFLASPRSHSDLTAANNT